MSDSGKRPVLPRARSRTLLHGVKRLSRYVTTATEALLETPNRELLRPSGKQPSLHDPLEIDFQNPGASDILALALSYEGGQRNEDLTYVAFHLRRITDPEEYDMSAHWESPKPCPNPGESGVGLKAEDDSVCLDSVPTRAVMDAFSPATDRTSSLYEDLSVRSYDEEETPAFHRPSDAETHSLSVYSTDTKPASSPSNGPSKPDPHSPSERPNQDRLIVCKLLTLANHASGAGNLQFDFQTNPTFFGRWAGAFKIGLMGDAITKWTQTPDLRSGFIEFLDSSMAFNHHLDSQPVEFTRFRNCVENPDKRMVIVYKAFFQACEKLQTMKPFCDNDVVSGKKEHPSLLDTQTVFSGSVTTLKN